MSQVKTEFGFTFDVDKVDATYSAYCESCGLEHYTVLSKDDLKQLLKEMEAK